MMPRGDLIEQGHCTGLGVQQPSSPLVLGHHALTVALDMAVDGAQRAFGLRKGDYGLMACLAGPGAAYVLIRSLAREA